MRIAVDARPFSHPQAGGFRTYVRALLSGLRERAGDGISEESLILYLDRPLSAEALSTLPPGAQTRIVGASRLRADWQIFPRLLREDAPDLFFGTANYVPTLPAKLASVVTIHDAMGVATYPWDVGVRRNARERFINRYWAWQTRRSAREARRVLTVSHGSAKEIRRAMGLPPERLRVVYNGIETMGAVESSFAREVDSLLAIESPDPRKNVDVVYRALARVEERVGRRVRLRVVANGERAIERVRQSGAASAEILTGLTDDQLAEAYARTLVFVWPSRWEGFGLPPLEAMSHGCAVVSSSAPVMPEILGDLPRYASPDAPDEFAAQIAALLDNESERDERARRGREHAATFTCRRMAEETVAVWREAIAG